MLRYLSPSLVVLALATFSPGCNNSTSYPPSVIPGGTSPTPTPTPVPVTADVIEFRVTGTVAIPVSIKFSTSVDGLTVLPAVDLPYSVTLRSTEASTFLFLDATCNAVYTTAGGSSGPVLQTQIFVNGRVFRDAFTQGFGPIEATASGTWRRGS